MKITHSSGEEYDLTPGTQLEMSRVNPFFNDYGEQSLPITLPTTDKNRRLLVYPDDIAGISKMSQRTNAMIQQGVFSVPCRQAILSGNRKTGIETSFYLNTGAFYEKIKDVQLSTIFEKKVITFTSVTEAIAYCRNLYINHSDLFACFPVMIESGTLNQLGENGTDGYPLLYNAQARTETVDEKTISLSPGFYITPFIRANHLLREIFAYWGYTLADNFFTQTIPFSDMVFLNSTIDTIVKNEIRYSQIVPDCMVTTILNVYRYRFCCEFVPDEVNKIMNIILFDDILKSKADTDLGKNVVGKYTVNHPAQFKQLKLSCEHIDPPALNSESETTGRPVFLSAKKEDSGDSFKTLSELQKKYPDAEFNPISGEFIRTGFQGIIKVEQRLGYITMDYYSGGTLEAESKESPDAAAVMVYVPKRGADRPGTTAKNQVYVYIGKGRALNSSIILDTVNDSNSEETLKKESSDEELRPILCFVRSDGKRDYGTVLNMDADGNRLWNYTLAYHGLDGLFERFWRNYDNLLRNSLLDVQANLLLTDVQKVMLSEYKKVLIDSQELLPNVIKYTFSKEIQESSFLTTKLYEPISRAPRESDRVSGVKSKYYWGVNYSRSNSSDTTRTKWTYKEEPTVIYYAPPTIYQYLSGGRYHEASYPVSFYSRPTDSVDGILTIWLEARIR